MKQYLESISKSDSPTARVALIALSQGFTNGPEAAELVDALNDIDERLAVQDQIIAQAKIASRAAKEAAEAAKQVKIMIRTYTDKKDVSKKEFKATLKAIKSEKKAARKIAKQEKKELKKAEKKGQA